MPVMSEDPNKPPVSGVARLPASEGAWSWLRSFTPARIGLGRAGISLPTAAQLDFQLAHARARDAVHRPLDVAALQAELEDLGQPTLAMHSAAASRAQYLQRPDLGRQLDETSLAVLSARRERRPIASAPCADIAIAVVDGLSSLAVQRHAVPLIAALKASTNTAPWHLAPVAVVEQGRVAVGDVISELLGVRLMIVLIGERPGLSSPDSLGIYLTWAPRLGRHDAERNCISNVRPEGLPYEAAAARLVYLVDEAMRRQITGVDLKDDRQDTGPVLRAPINFLLGQWPPAA